MRLGLFACVLSLAALVAVTVSVGAAPAAGQHYPFVASDFTSLGPFTAAGTVVFNTDTLTYGGTPGGVVADGDAVFTFDSVNVPAGTTVVGVGSRPLAILSNSTFAVAGTLNVDGASGTDVTKTHPAGGAGGGAGGDGNLGAVAGSGPGAGQPGSGTVFAGSGGGGFGGAGGAGGQSISGTAGAGGTTYGNLASSLQGGSGGASGQANFSFAGGGGGGGGVFLYGASTISVAATGTVSANGGNGAVSGCGASGGGSGGGIVFFAASVANAGAVHANGGAGGKGNNCSDGGGGGGGRILVAAPNSGAGTYSANGGAEGTAGGGGYSTRGDAVNGSAGVVSFNSSAFGGTITVTKQLVSSPTAPAKFNLQVDGVTQAANVGNGGTTGAIAVVAAGTHTVSETAGTNANLNNYATTISCSNGASGTGTSLSGITVNAGQNVTCTITNSSGTLTVTKQVQSNSIDPGRWNLRIDGTTKASCVGNGGTTGPVQVAAGYHDVSETVCAASGSFTTYITCSDGSRISNSTNLDGVYVGPGGSTTCTVRNVRKLYKVG